jgi:serine phosphatase RsbU (regulator of sigma subunit)
MELEGSRVHKLLVDSSAGYRNATKQEQITIFANVVIMLYTFPLLIVTLGWLILRTDLLLPQREAPALLILLVLLLLFTRSRFRFQMSISSGGGLSLTGSFDFIIIWSAALIYGPTALWLTVISSAIVFLVSRRFEANIAARSQLGVEAVYEVVASSLAALIGLFIFELLGGGYPYGPLTLAAFVPAIAATLAAGLLPVYLLLPVPLLAARYLSRFQAGATYVVPGVVEMVRTSAVGSGLSVTMAVFALLGALIYTNVGFIIYLFLASGVLFAGLLANQLTRSIERAEQRSRELAVLEELGRALIVAAPGDNAALSTLLAQHATRMVPGGRIEIWFSPDIRLLPEDGSRLPQSADVHTQLEYGGEPFFYVDDVIVTETTGGVTPHDGVAVSITDDSIGTVGGIYALVRRDREKIANYLPAIQSLAAQIETAVSRARAHQQALANERMQQELNVAARIQSSFLPDSVPHVDKWDIAATLIPARQCSGDFYDFLPFEDGRLGIIVADVADKGTGAALYMALSRTVMRTFAMQGNRHPAHVIKQANDRILQDTTSNQFVTTFYGILDPASGVMTYCNAGHNPTFILRAADGSVEALGETGIPVGMVDELDWEEGSATMQPGDIMLLYTDGVPEAQDADEGLFEESRLLEVAGDFGRNATATRDAIIESIQEFVGDAPQFDDITLVVVKRDAI